MNKSVILHISDIHHGASSAHANPDGLVQIVEQAIDQVKTDPEFHPKYLFCSGDLGSCGDAKSIALAEKSLLRIAGRLGIDRRRIVLCPGNHDIDHTATEQYLREHPEAVQHGAENQPRWGVGQYRAYLSVVRNVCGVDRGEMAFLGPTDPDQVRNPSDICSLQYYPDDELIVYSLNSTVYESHRESDRYGYVGKEQLDRLDGLIDSFCAENHVRDIYSMTQIVVVHHPFSAPDDRDPSAMRDPFYLPNWLWTRGIGLVLHGHQHYSRTVKTEGRDANNAERAFVCAGAGSVGARPGEMIDRRNSLNLIGLSGTLYGARVVRIRPGEYVHASNSWRYVQGEERRYVFDPSGHQATKWVRGLGLEKALSRLFQTREDILQGKGVMVEGADAAFETYVEALGRIGSSGRLRVTSTLDSQFWSEKLKPMVSQANIDLKKRVGKVKVQRLFFTDGDISEYIRRVVQRADSERRAANDEAEWNKLLQVIANLHHLATEFDMKVLDKKSFRTANEFNPIREELAIYEFEPGNTRIDQFKLDDYGQVLKVEVRAGPALDDSYRRDFTEAFDATWTNANAKTVDEYLTEIHAEIERVENTIGYTKEWLLEFDRLVDSGDQTLIDESKVVIDYVKNRPRRRVKGPHFDVGVCTGRYVELLKKWYHSKAIDIDDDVKKFIHGRFRELEFKFGDIRKRNEAEALGRDYSLITCMLGTCCHFGLEKKPVYGGLSGFEVAMQNMLSLLRSGGAVVVSAWKAAAEDWLLHHLYTPIEVKRLLRETPNHDAVQAAVEQAGRGYELTVLAGTPHLDLYAIERKVPT